MPESPIPLNYAGPEKRGSERITKGSVLRFLAGVGAYGTTAVLVCELGSLQSAILLGRIGLGSCCDGTRWAVGLGFVGLVIYLQRRRRWTGFTLGVVAGVAVTVLVGAIVYVLWARAMGQLH